SFWRVYFLVGCPVAGAKVGLGFWPEHVHTPTLKYFQEEACSSPLLPTDSEHSGSSGAKFHEGTYALLMRHARFCCHVHIENAWCGLGAYFPGSVTFRSARFCHQPFRRQLPKHRWHKTFPGAAGKD